MDPGRVTKRYDVVVVVVVVVVVGVGVVVTVFEKCLRLVNTQRTVTKLRIHIRDIIPDRSTVLDFSSSFIISLHFFNNTLNSFLSLYTAAKFCCCA